MYYHGSPVGGLSILEPRVSIHEKAFVYLSSDPVHASIYAARSHMYPYGFAKDTGKLTYDEPYPGFLVETYGGKTGYVYEVEAIDGIVAMEGIPRGFICQERVTVCSVEVIEDLFQRLLDCERWGLVNLVWYGKMPAKKQSYYRNTVCKMLIEHDMMESTEPYPVYLRTKFPQAYEMAKEKLMGEVRTKTEQVAGGDATR